jgi:hypothetical protein
MTRRELLLSAITVGVWPEDHLSTRKIGPLN